MKNIWISALGSRDQSVPRVAAAKAALHAYGLGAAGHFWNDANDKLAWRAALEALQEARSDLWLILADGEAMARPAIRYGLSLLAASLRHFRGHAFPIVLLWPGQVPAEEERPPLLRAASELNGSNGAWPAQVVAKAHRGTPAPAPDYRLNILGDERLGQWFEIGPREGEWSGAIFAIAGPDAAIDFHAVGPTGGLPQKTVLEFAQQGLRLTAGERDFTAWAVRNRLDTDTSYYVRVTGCPEAILFLPYADDDTAETTIVALA